MILKEKAARGAARQAKDAGASVGALLRVVGVGDAAGGAEPLLDVLAADGEKFDDGAEVGQRSGKRERERGGAGHGTVAGQGAGSGKVESGGAGDVAAGRWLVEFARKREVEARAT